MTLRDYTDAAGRTFHAPTGEASVPGALTGLVSAIEGLDARPSERPAISSHPIAAGPPDGMTPAIIDRVYELEGLRALNLNGEGQTVAIVSLDTFDPADVAAYDRLAGTSGPPVEKIKVNGGVATPGDGQDEVNLDIEVVRAVAPKAQILDYEAPNKGGAIASHHRPDRPGRSGGYRRRSAGARASWMNSSSEIARTARSLAAAAAAGISVFVASGDHGAYDCIDQDRTDLRISVDSPAGDLNVDRRRRHLPVDARGRDLYRRSRLGGTAHRLGARRRTQHPTTGDRRGRSGSGVDNARSNGFRQVPDVAAAADPASGFMVVSGGEAGPVGGTSAASPFWAGFSVLVRELAEQEGVRGLGPLGPTLYEVAAAQPPGSVFHDVTRGGNLLDNAGPGWDYATGLGTPRGTPLARAIVDHVKGAEGVGSRPPYPGVSRSRRGSRALREYPCPHVLRRRSRWPDRPRDRLGGGPAPSAVPSARASAGTPSPSPSASAAPAQLLLKVTTEGGFINPSATLAALPTVAVLRGWPDPHAGLLAVDPPPLLATVAVRDVGPAGATAIRRIKGAGRTSHRRGAGGPRDSGRPLLGVVDAPPQHSAGAQPEASRQLARGPGAAGRPRPLSSADHRELGLYRRPDRRSCHWLLACMPGRPIRHLPHPGASRRSHGRSRRVSTRSGRRPYRTVASPGCGRASSWVRTRRDSPRSCVPRPCSARSPREAARTCSGCDHSSPMRSVADLPRP